MIESLGDYKYKSWKQESNLGSTQFKQINILFGHNGAGKSSLATGLYKAHLESGGAKATARFFGSKYVENTLLLEEKEGIRGVVSNFGEPDVATEEKIAENNKKIAKIDDEYKTNSDKLKDTTGATETLIKDIVSRRKESNRRINNKPSEKTVEEKVKLWSEDYNKSVKDFPDEDYNKITGSIDYTSENEQITNLQIFEMPDYDENIVDNVAEVFKKPYSKVDIPESEVVTWMQEGLHIHEGKKVCEFCGNDLDTAKITVRIDGFVNNKLHQATLQLEANKGTLKSISEVATSTIANKELYTSLLNLDSNYFSELEEASKLLNVLIEDNIKNKIEDMTSTENMPEGIDSAIEKIGELAKDLSNAKAKHSKEILEKINKLETLVKGAIGFEIKNSTAIKENLLALETSNKAMGGLIEDKKVLVKANADLASKKSDLADFSTYLNPILTDLELNFELVMDEECYVLRHTDGTPLKVSDISDGERNLLALVYFYYEMLSDSSGAFKDAIELIVVDDPLSSLDDGNKFYISELIKSLLNMKDTQVFLLTHSWDDFCNFVYGQNDKENVSRFEISKSSSVSSIKSIEQKRMDKPYKVLYQEVYIFSQKAIEDVDDAEILHMPNIMRRLIEEYVKFSVDVDFATAHKTGDISKSLFGQEIAELSNTKKQKLNELLSVCNILSHKANQPKNGSEVHKAAKFLMKSIESSNKYHHLKMRGE